MKSVAKTKKAVAGSIAILQQQTGMKLTQKFNNLTQYKSHTTNTLFKGDGQSFSKPHNSSHGNIRHYSTTPIVVSSEEEIDTLLKIPSEPIIQLILDPEEYESWTKEQVCSLLCTKKQLGGASLVIEDIKPLYNGGFKGTSMVNIIHDIQQHGDQCAIDEICKSFPISRDTSKTIVMFVDNLFKTRLFHSWSIEQAREQLCKPVGKGGAGLLKENFQVFYENYPDLFNTTKVSDLEKDTKLPNAIREKVSSWVKQHSILQVTKISFTENYPSFSRDEKQLLIQANTVLNDQLDDHIKYSSDISDNEKRWYLSFCELIIKGHTLISKTPREKESYAVHLYRLMDEAFTIVTNGLPLQELDFMKEYEQLKHSILQFNTDSMKNSLFLKGTLAPFKHRYAKKNIEVPMLDGTIAKDILPFIPSLQFDLFNQAEKELDLKIKNGNTIVLVAPSGMGKTALISRRLGVNPGMYFSCSSISDSHRMRGRGKDNISLELNYKFKQLKSNIQQYATSRQLVQIAFITKLISIHAALDIWEQTLERKPFNTPLQFLSYAQWNSNSKFADNVSAYINASKWNLLPILSLRRFTVFLMQKLYARLNIASTEPFIIGIDEANIFSMEPTPLVSPNGTPRDLLSILISEVSDLKSITPFEISDIYCGTLFTSDIVDIIQSSLGKSMDITSKVFLFFGLDIITFNQALQMLGTVYNIEKMFENKVSKSTEFIFPTRRRVIGLIYSALFTENQNVEEIFISVYNGFSDELKIRVLERFDKKTSVDKVDPHILIDFILRYENRNIFTSKLGVNQTTASSLVNSGFARPVQYIDDVYYFDTADSLANYVARAVLDDKYPYISRDFRHNEKLIILRKYLSVPHTNTKDWEQIIGLSFLMYDNVPLQEIPFFSTSSNLKTYYKGETLTSKLEIRKMMTSAEFYVIYRDSLWGSKLLREYEGNVNSVSLGDLLFWYCVEHYNEKVDETTYFKDLINGLYFLPSELCHADAICFNFDTWNLLMISNKLHNCVRNDFTNALLEGAQSLDYTKFYTSYASGRFLNKCNWWGDFKQVHSMLQNMDNQEERKIIRFLAHFHINYSNIDIGESKHFKELSSYEDGGKFIVMDTDLKKIYEPDIIAWLQSNMFATAQFGEINLDY